jgi:hypothetical protein
MGWLYMNSLGGFASPKAYLEDQFTCTNEHKSSRILRSSLVAMRTWYAACEQIDKASGAREVFAIVCLVSYNARSKDGHVFGYKDMTEHMGPCEANCPAAILALLTPTDHEHAVDWRNRCRKALDQARRAVLHDGDMIVFTHEITFSDGQASRRQTVFQIPGPNGELRAQLYQIRKWRTAQWTVVPKIAQTQLAA